jgi:hypothetical protein
MAANQAVKFISLIIKLPNTEKDRLEFAAIKKHR